MIFFEDVLTQGLVLDEFQQLQDTVPDLSITCSLSLCMLTMPLDLRVTTHDFVLLTASL
jgi:hypothetical protein